MAFWGGQQGASLKSWPLKRLSSVFIQCSAQDWCSLDGRQICSKLKSGAHFLVGVIDSLPKAHEMGKEYFQLPEMGKRATPIDGLFQQGTSQSRENLNNFDLDNKWLGYYLNFITKLFL